MPLMIYYSMFISYHFTTCYYPLNLFIGISSHLGRVTIMSDSIGTSPIFIDVLWTFSLASSFVKGSTKISSVCTWSTLTAPMETDYPTMLFLMTFFSSLTVTLTVFNFCNSRGTIAMDQHNCNFFPIRESLLVSIFNNLLLH